MKDFFKEYDKSKKKLDIILDIMPTIFRDDEFEKMKATGADAVEFNEFQYGKLGDRTVEMGMEMLERNNLKIEFGLFKGFYKEFGLKRFEEYDFTKHPTIIELSAFDEPDYEEFELCNKIETMMEKKCPNIPVVTNLYPEYVPESVIKTDYENYITKFFEEVASKRKNYKIVSCDFYPFEKINGRIIMTETWLHNHVLFAELSKKYDTDLRWCIQTSNYLNHRVVDKHDILMQMYMALAFNVVKVSCFTYGVPLIHPDFPAGSDGMIGQNYQPSSMYYASQEAFKEIRKVEKVLRSFRYNGVKTYIGSNNTNKKNSAFERLTGSTKELDKFNYIDTVLCNEDTVVVESYDKENKRFGYFVINYNDPYFDKRDKVTITFKNVKGGQAYVDSNAKSFEGNRFEFELLKGGCAFIIPETV